MQRTLASSLVLSAALAAGGSAFAQDSAGSGTPDMGTNQSSSGIPVDRDDSRYDGTSATPGGEPAPGATGTGSTDSTVPGRRGMGGSSDSGSGEDETHAPGSATGSEGGGTAPGATTPGAMTPGSGSSGSADSATTP